VDKKTSIFTRIVTPENVFFEEHIESLTIKITNGYSTFLPNHSPKISIIEPSTLTMKCTSEKNKVAVILDGVIDVSPTHIYIIANNVI
jgi:F0F1-type ATP synthase epsilon subunit